jgi:poly(3-hydroxybutyrate) depolymerase
VGLSRLLPDVAGDHGDVKAVVQKFTQQFKLNRMPIYMWGISSGAGFAIKFPATMYIDGIVSGERV